MIDNTRYSDKGMTDNTRYSDKDMIGNTRYSDKGMTDNTRYSDKDMIGNTRYSDKGMTDNTRYSDKDMIDDTKYSDKGMMDSTTPPPSPLEAFIRLKRSIYTKQNHCFRDAHAPQRSTDSTMVRYVNPLKIEEDKSIQFLCKDVCKKGYFSSDISVSRKFLPYSYKNNKW